MDRLSEKRIIGLFKEEWRRRVDAVISEGAQPVSLTNAESDDLLSPELKIRHTQSGIRYTVDSVGLKDVVLRTPEGEKFLLTKDELDSDYSLD